MLDFIKEERERNASKMQRAGSTIEKERLDYAIKLNHIVDSIKVEKSEYDKRLNSFYEKYCNVTPPIWTKKKKLSLKERIYTSLHIQAD